MYTSSKSNVLLEIIMLLKNDQSKIYTYMRDYLGKSLFKKNWSAFMLHKKKATKAPDSPFSLFLRIRISSPYHHSNFAV